MSNGSQTRVYDYRKLFCVLFLQKFLNLIRTHCLPSPLSNSHSTGKNFLLMFTSRLCRSKDFCLCFVLAALHIYVVGSCCEANFLLWTKGLQYLFTYQSHWNSSRISQRNRKKIGLRAYPKNVCFLIIF